MASASALGNLNDLARRQGDKESGQRFYEEARALYEERLGALQGGARNMEMALVLHYLAILAFHQDDYGLSRTRYYQSLEIFRELGEKNACAIMFNNLGNMALAQGDAAEARDLYEQSLQLHRECDDRRSIALVLNNLGLLAQKHGDQELARMRFEESLEISRELREQKFIVLTLNHMVGALRILGDFLLAREMQSESLILCKDLGDLMGVAAGLEGMASVKLASVRGQKPETQDAAARWAARLWGAAWSLRQRVGAPLPSEEQGEYDGAAAQVRSILGDDAFAVAWEAGGAERWERVAEEALEESHW